MPPRMIVVAGPPGGGKSSAFPLAKLGTRYFNADDRAAELNGGAYLGIPKHIRETVNHEFEPFVSVGRIFPVASQTMHQRQAH